jgi:Questin oxidase-like
VTTDYSRLDEALEMLRPYGTELRNGNSNHAPMAAEAMCVLGRGDAVIDWVDRYRTSLEPAGTPRSIIREPEWRQALGHGDRVADWQSFFANELAEHPSPEVLDRWVARLAPGIIAAAAHGAIRTAHAARSLNARENDLRLRELAAGLAYWAAEYQTLPDTPDVEPHLTMSPVRAIEAIELLPVERRGVLTSLTGALPELDRFEPFKRVISMIDIPRDTTNLLSQLTNGFADVCVANATTPFLTIAFIHCVTALYAIRNLAPQLSIETTRLAVRYGWQASASLYTVLGMRPHPGVVTTSIDLTWKDLDFASADLDSTREDLIERAIRSGDEHAIKFTEACLSEYSLNPSPTYLHAANHAIVMLTPTD